MNKEKFQNTAEAIKSMDTGKKKKIAVIVAVIIVFLLIVTHIHHCDECDRTYFGNKHTLTSFGETYDLCKECYDGYYSFR